MASIFTFDPDLTRVSSPWDRQLQPINSDKSRPASFEIQIPEHVARLEAEPQEGPVEYKLHLLLRTGRRLLRSQRAAHLTSGPFIGSPGRLPHPVAGNKSSDPLVPQIPPTHQSRQYRLEHLTTQLLWRLQQSCSNHVSSASNIILPSFPPTSAELAPPRQPGKLIAGLEDSQGALYEIGVSDDGTLVGLVEDEMHESLNNLRAMAGCLGCEVEVLRMVVVGSAEWIDPADVADEKDRKVERSKLVVAEALVKPCLATDVRKETATDDSSLAIDLAVPGLHSLTQGIDGHSSRTKPQLRVSLTGATLSGKSSLLGTLTTSALDNARGKSRLSLLKHRHEISSGLTSSVSQELIGYGKSTDDIVEVVNYATNHVESWTDIHSASAPGRLVLVSDSAGHPRYRRTAVKGLVGWSPHWTLICMPGDEPDSKGRSMQAAAIGSHEADFDLSHAYLDLCLRLDLPLVVVITKLDAASKQSLRAVLTRILSSLKDSGRRPVIMPSTARQSPGASSTALPVVAISEVNKLAAGNNFNAELTVPIVMTSAVEGTGIDMLHALLAELPILRARIDSGHGGPLRIDPLFHIEDVYTKSTEPDLIIVAGYIKNAHLSIGDRLFIGPFSRDYDDSEDSDNPSKRRPSSGHQSRSFPGASRRPSGGLSTRSEDALEWRAIRVVSIRNLRLPVTTLYTDQVGTIGFTVSPDPVATPAFLRPDLSPNLHAAIPAGRIRKGMVIVNGPRAASTSIIARFSRDDLGNLAVGSQVVLYVASVRATARIVSASVPMDSPTKERRQLDELGESISSLTLLDDEDEKEKVAGSVTHEQLLVALHFEGGREYVEIGDRVLVMPGGGPGVFANATGPAVAALEGFVGTVEEVAS